MNDDSIYKDIRKFYNSHATKSGICLGLDDVKMLKNALNEVGTYLINNGAIVRKKRLINLEKKDKSLAIKKNQCIFFQE